MTSSTTSTRAGRFDWLRPPKGGPGGTMSLMDHLRELRYRLTVSVLAIAVAAIVSGVFYERLVPFVTNPFEQAKRWVLENTNGTAEIMLTAQNVVSPFTLAVVACLLSGLVFSCPVWLYEIWAFFAPALLKQEKKYILSFVGAATPLFLLGCLVGYWIWPRGVAVMVGFTPQGFEIKNLLDMVDFLQKQVMIMLVFGISFMLPVLLVMLCLAGVVHGYQLGRWRKGVILGSTIFAAVVTPTVDPFSMLALVVPMTLLFLVAEVCCRLIDRKRGITKETVAEFNPDLDVD
ncbi:twin-arginine translocase subunit TatC [uncultured Tessaracoccus sp.]|uniref:twin-arginine translocase subunit TatC n=1 Tax=uncultured Tessaracoccus sp. TaxID=905023 RepID=UPI0025F15BB2|nr:twin-arginine translocase subunit TatC [uncultured Tessaracoccus sp.]